MSAVIPIEVYKELLEDLHDLVVIAERRDEPTIRNLRERLEQAEEEIWH